jgi:O-antigen/teichoic acid export membrane protein
MAIQVRPEESSKDRELAVVIGKSTLFGVIARCAQVGTRLLTVPIVIAHLGIAGYGIWAILMTAAAYMRFGSIGIKSAFQKYVAEATGTGDFQTTNRLLSTGTVAMFILSLAGLVPISIYSAKLAHAAGVPAEFLKSSTASISVLAVIMLISNVGAAYEAILMGGHRIDIARRYTTFFTVVEAIAIVALLRSGFGLFAMACTMGLSELGFVACCYIASRKVLPQVQVRWEYVTKDVVPELFRYGGSYQLVNILEVAYNAIVPIALLRTFGAEAAGIFALVVRLQGSAQMLSDAVLLPILSGGARTYNSETATAMKRLIVKSFKVTMGLAILPLGFLAIFGTLVVYAWTGQENPALKIAFWLICLSGLFSSLSILGLVLYRVSGKAVLDNVRQVLRIGILLAIACFARRLGFYGVLAGIAVAELGGVIFMVHAISHTFDEFKPKVLLPDALRIILAALAIFTTGVIAAHLPLPEIGNPRLLAAVRLGLVSLGCLVATWPALVLTNAVTVAERRVLLRVLFPGRTPPTVNPDPICLVE